MWTTFGATSGRPDGHRKNCAFQTKKGKKFAPEKITETDAKHNEHAFKVYAIGDVFKDRGDGNQSSATELDKWFINQDGELSHFQDPTQ